VNVAIAITSGALNVGNEVRKVMGRVQLTPPIKASARNQITGRRRRLSARKASARRSLEGIFMR
jgi:hypothetical protein